MQLAAINTNPQSFYTPISSCNTSQCSGCPQHKNCLSNELTEQELLAFNSIAKQSKKLTKGEIGNRSKLEKLFYYVRDDIRFGFTKNGDMVKASETIILKMGQCNTKGTLFLALCKSIEIPARIHFSTIK